ncbi:MAG: hypothetical protein LBR70_05790 [Lactobacillaceae bacterium]|jgi:hypothetical protein|nr:hypothetical protein [Lactobacillaceae bacterium]
MVVNGAATLSINARKVKALTLVSSVAAKKYDTKITNSFSSGVRSLLSTNLGKSVTNNATKIIDATSKFLRNFKLLNR